MQLQDFIQVVCGKNAGPRRFTLDIIFRNDADYQRATQSKALTAARLVPLYGAAAEAISVINYPLSRAINIVVPWLVRVRRCRRPGCLRRATAHAAAGE